MPDEAQVDLPPATEQEKAMADRLLTQMPIALPVALSRAYYSTFSLMLKNPSLARRRDPQMQRNMRNDPDVEAPLQDLVSSIAGSDWQIELARGRASEKVADGVRDIIEEIPGFSDLCGQLLEAVWYGPGAVNVIWGRNTRNQIGVERWLPIHSDTLAVDQTGNIALRVGTKYRETNPDAVTKVGFDSWVHPLTEDERRCMLLHTYKRRGGDFEDPNEVAYAYLGRGVRDVAWYTWMLKQTGLQNWSAYLERYAMGIRKGYYPAGDEKAEEAMAKILANMIGDVSVNIPRTRNSMTGTKDDYDIEIVEAAASKAKVFLEFIAWCSSNIKELIIGQTGTTEGVASGMGSGIADQHAKTFNRHQRYVALALAETIQRQLVVPIVQMNWGPQEFYPQFKFAIADPDMGPFMDGVKSFIDIGGEVAEDDVLQRIGISKPRPGQRVLSLDTVNAAFGPAGGGPLGGKSVNRGRKSNSNGHPVPAVGEGGRDEFARQIDELFCSCCGGDGQ